MAEDSAYAELMNELQENLRISEKEESDKKENEEKINDEEDDFELVTGYKSGSTLLWIPPENCLYKQNVYSKTHDGMAYTCYDAECTARKVLKSDANESSVITINSTHIPHLPMKKNYKELHYLNLMKSMCRTEPNSVTNEQIFKKVQAM